MEELLRWSGLVEWDGNLRWLVIRKSGHGNIGLVCNCGALK